MSVGTKYYVSVAIGAATFLWLGKASIEGTVWPGSPWVVLVVLTVGQYFFSLSTLPLAHNLLQGPVHDGPTWP